MYRRPWPDIAVGEPRRPPPRSETCRLGSASWMISSCWSTAARPIPKRCARTSRGSWPRCVCGCRRPGPGSVTSTRVWTSWASASSGGASQAPPGEWSIPTRPRRPSAVHCTFSLQGRRHHRAAPRADPTDRSSVARCLLRQRNPVLRGWRTPRWPPWRLYPDPQAEQRTGLLPFTAPETLDGSSRPCGRHRRAERRVHQAPGSRDGGGLAASGGCVAMVSTGVWPA